MRLLLFAAFTMLLGAPFGSAVAEDDAASATTDSGTLIVHVEGLESSDGSLRFVMFDSQENFLKNAVRAEVIEIEDRQGTWTIEDLPYGVYAVLVHHDVDGSGVMERHWYGKPKEPTGTSNDAPARFGPPKFKKAKFVFEAPTQTMTIVVK